ncbi:hypothetical protein GCM10009565_85720 [Amycolatopsis albidoflavus]
MFSASATRRMDSASNPSAEMISSAVSTTCSTVIGTVRRRGLGLVPEFGDWCRAARRSFGSTTAPYLGVFVGRTLFVPGLRTRRDTAAQD